MKQLDIGQYETILTEFLEVRVTKGRDFIKAVYELKYFWGELVDKYQLDSKRGERMVERIAKDLNTSRTTLFDCATTYRRLKSDFSESRDNGILPDTALPADDEGKIIPWSRWISSLRSPQEPHTHDYKQTTVFKCDCGRIQK